MRAEARLNSWGLTQPETPLFHGAAGAAKKTADSSPGLRPVRNDKELGKA